jgi:hypothetical protein
MALGPHAYEVLDACANIIVQGGSYEPIDLSFLNDVEQSWYVHVYATLRSQVEQKSSGERTLRLALSKLFADHVLGPNLYLANCPYDSDSATVTSLTEDMQLVSIGPYKDGFKYPAPPVSAEALQVQNLQVVIEAEGVWDQQATDDVNELANFMLGKLYGIALADENQILITEIRKEMIKSSPVSFKKIAYFCRRMDLTINRLASLMYRA